MIPIVEANGKQEYLLLGQLAARSQETDRRVTESVEAILSDVRTRGDEAVTEYTRRFDGTEPLLAPIEREQLRRLAESCDPDVYAALERAYPVSGAALTAEELSHFYGILRREGVEPVMEG